MPDLLPRTLLDGATAAFGATRLSELPLVPLWTLAPYPGQQAAFSKALKAAHGVAFPEPGRVTSAGEVQARWSGREQAFLLGVDVPFRALAQHGAVTDVSDVHARLLLEGVARADILARLVPLDLRPARFPAGHATRSLLGHMTAHFTAHPDSIEIAIMRSFARTAFHEIEEAMRSVAARATL